MRLCVRMTEVLARRPAGAVGLAAAVLVAFFLTPGTAQAQIGSDRYSSIVIDAGSGTALEAVNADEPRYPASLTKLMTLYLVFEGLRDRRITLDEPVPVSMHAAMMSPTKLGLLPSTRISVEEAILGLVTKSANDAAAALGELMGGDEDRFAQMMTLRARALGMAHTTFRNASGLPDADQVTTARDLAILARHLITDFPGFYGYFSTPSFRFHGRVIMNHDHMLETYPGADGMKTGYTVASGFNLVTSASRSGLRLIGVVMGAATTPERDYHMASLLDAAYDRLGVVGYPREQRVASRLPSIISVAHASTLPPPPPPVPPLPAGKLASRTPAPVTRYGVQVGTFPTERAARDAAATARRLADDGEPRVEAVNLRGRMVWRAQLGGLSAAEAQGVCTAMARHRAPCFVLRPDPGQIASR